MTGPLGAHVSEYSTLAADIKVTNARSKMFLCVVHCFNSPKSIKYLKHTPGFAGSFGLLGPLVKYLNAKANQTADLLVDIKRNIISVVFT